MSGHTVATRSTAEQAAAFTRQAVDSWFPSIYDCLRDIARRRLMHEAPGHTLQPTALVNDAYVRLVEYDHDRWNGRAHFLAVAARILREVLVDHARRRAAAKRGKGWCRVALSEGIGAADADTVSIMALDDALTRLARDHGRAARIVELRFFSGMTIEETARVLDVSPGTVKADWRFARAWLNNELDQFA